MHATVILQRAARVPRIPVAAQHFITFSAGHPSPSPSMSSTGSSYESFAAYRSRAYQHGPLHQASVMRGSVRPGSGASKKPISSKGQPVDHEDLSPPAQRLPWTEAEIDAIESGGASLVL
ncbi:hypothetical protein BDV26DRAFT_293435 [Aspergillus bertholletiae]|uniref:Uncharacterized protein n=1 Tax=Aspergillus bertholletiae TaxID=1226010 RepID=A0A5N7B538_9EURO|nr:hypothetical protein BDV26DRAFT_293435 [Aspergillus bertholletiae]